MNSSIMVRLIEANRKAGRNVIMVDHTAPTLPALSKLSTSVNEDPIAGSVFTEAGNSLYKLIVGGRRYYVNDIMHFINKGSLQLKVDNQ